MYKVHQDATYLPLDLTCEKMNVRDNRTVPMVSATASKNKNGVIHISLSNVDADNAQEITVNLPDVNAAKTALFLWSRRESNPCPKAYSLSFYECSLFFDIPSAPRE